MRGEGGQAAVEWIALVLAATLALGAAAAFSGRETDRGLGETVAKRIARAASGVGAAPAAEGSPAGRSPAGRSPAGTTPAPRAAPSPPRAAPSPPRAAPPGPVPGAVDAFRALRGVGDVAKRAWIVCLGYRRWKYELEHPSAPNEALPVDDALAIVNTCLNPHDYLLED
ncbi:MAG TPA: hypothetical protein VGW14_07800 [Thermoleophilaceae bacterium]|nr:hypothetical protein [Thermoleophilaceae bacterium]